MLVITLVSGLVTALSGTTPIEVVVQEGDAVPGVGAVTTIAEVSVNDVGDVIVEADTDNADLDADAVVLLDGVLAFREGQAVSAPAGATLDGFDSITGGFSDDGDVVWNLFLDGTGGFDDDSGVYENDTLLFQEGSMLTVGDITPGSPWLGFFDVEQNDSDQFLVLGSVDDPAIASSVDRVLVLFDRDAGGGISGATLVAREGQVLPGQTEPVEDMETGTNNVALNDAGQVLFIAELEGDPSADHAIYLDDALVAQEGSPSPVENRDWQSLSLAEIDLDDAGGWVVSGDLDGSPADDAVIATDEGVLVREGDTLPAIAPFMITSFGTTGSSGPVFLGNNGNVLWSAEWDAGARKGLFLNDRLLLEVGVTMVGGMVLEDIFAVSEGYTLSPDGERVVVRARLFGSVDVALLIDVGPWVSLGKGLGGASPAPCLVGSGTLLAGDPLTLELQGSAPLVATNLVIGLTELCTPFKGGTLAPAVDLVLGGLVLDADGDLTLAGTTPAGLPSGTELVFQFWTPDPSGPKGFHASNAVKGIVP